MKDQPNRPLQIECISSPWKAIGRIVIALPFTLLLLPIQTAVLALNLRSASWLPRFFHRQWCRIFGIDVRVSGWISTERPVLFVANHVSYLDFIVLSSVLEATFVAKAEIAGWPILGILARLQRTLFVKRLRRHVAEERDEISKRLDAGERLILFPEGTSADGVHVLPFKSALFSVAKRAPGRPSLTIQPVSLAYTQLDGIPLNRALRPQYAWYGDMSLVPHMFKMLGLGKVTVEVNFHETVTGDMFATRKLLAEFCHRVVVSAVDSAISGRALPRSVQNNSPTNS